MTTLNGVKSRFLRLKKKTNELLIIIMVKQSSRAIKTEL